MDNRIFEKKKRITTLRGDDILALLGRSVDMNDLGLRTGSWHSVMPDQPARIDKILFQRYADFFKPASVMYFNDIFNPFALEEEELMAIPHIVTENNYYCEPKKYSRPKAEQQDSVQEKIRKVADRLGDAVKGDVRTGTAMAPNRLAEGQSAKVIKGNAVILGGNSI